MIIRDIDTSEMLEGNLPDQIAQADRVRNVFLYGRPESGRDDLLGSFLKSDLGHKRGFTLIDPSGEIVAAVRGVVPQDRMVVFDPSDPQGLWQLDYFGHTADSERALFLAVNNFVSILESTILLNRKFSVMAAKFVYMATLAASQLPQPDLSKIISFLDPKERIKLIPQIKDQKVKDFWEITSPECDTATLVEVASLTDKLRLLVTGGIGKNVFNPGKKKLDLLSVIQNGQFLLCDLSKAKIGEENSIFYGLLIVQMLQQAACARYNLPFDQRVVHQLYVNRFENYANKDIFASFISESRPLGINIHLVTESLHNLDRDMLGNIFGNFGNLACFKAGRQDAEILAGKIGLFTAIDFENLGHREMIVRLIADQKVEQPVKMRLGSWSKNQP